MGRPRRRVLETRGDPHGPPRGSDEVRAFLGLPAGFDPRFDDWSIVEEHRRRTGWTWETSGIPTDDRSPFRAERPEP
jgi:hypothetical protein